MLSTWTVSSVSGAGSEAVPHTMTLRQDGRWNDHQLTPAHRRLPSW